MTEIEKHESRLERKDRLLSREHLEKVSMEVAVSKALYAVAKDHQNEVDALLENGQSIKVLNSRGVHIATVGKSNPQPKFVVADMAVVLPGAVDAGCEVVDLLPDDESSEAYAAAVEVLAEHAPHLLRPVLPEHEEERLRDDVRTRWEVTGELPAGWEIQEARSGSTSVRVSKVGKEMVAHLLEGTKSVLEITEGGKDG